MKKFINYSHGGDVKSFAKEIDSAVGEVLDLSSNINFIQPNIDFKGCDIATYPTYDELFEIISSHFAINKNQIEFFNGGSSAIFSLMRHLPNQKCTIYSPAYLEYKRSALLASKELVLIDRFEKFDTVVEKDSLVVFVNPSTPDGKYYDLKSLFSMWIQQNATVIIDESFLEFSGGESVIKYLTYDKLYILKSFTKFYSCAGVRLGIVISNKENIKQLKQHESLWKISVFDAKFITDVLADKEFYQKTIDENKKAKVFLKQLLQNNEIFAKVYKGDANFFLVELAKRSAKEFQEKLKPYKIMIRDCSNFDFLDDRFVRIAVKSFEDLKRFQKALNEF